MVEEMSVFWFDYLPHGCLFVQVCRSAGKHSGSVWMMRRAVVYSTVL